VRFVLQILGVALILSGGLWALQGAGLVMWPAESFMLAQGQWVLYGLVAVAIGAVLLWLARRRPL
jgi:hypothetical protein